MPLAAPANGVVVDCAMADPDLVADIRRHPRRYYVNVHTTVFPGGAVRGQLRRR